MATPGTIFPIREFRNVRFLAYALRAQRAPSKSDGVSRAISVSAITEMYKKFAVMTRRDPTGYASHSGRIGSFSDATAAGEDTQVAAKSLG